MLCCLILGSKCSCKWYQCQFPVAITLHLSILIHKQIGCSHLCSCPDYEDLKTIFGRTELQHISCAVLWKQAWCFVHTSIFGQVWTQQTRHIKAKADLLLPPGCFCSNFFKSFLRIILHLMKHDEENSHFGCASWNFRQTSCNKAPKGTWSRDLRFFSVCKEHCLMFQMLEFNSFNFTRTKNLRLSWT